MAHETQGKLRLFWRFTGWVALIFLLPGIITMLIAMFEGRKAERLESAGADTMAVITEKDIEISTDSDGDKTTTYYLYFEFDHERRTYSDRESVGRAFYNRLGVGDTTPIRYWQPDPMVNEIEPGATRTNVLVTKIISVIMLVLAGLWGERCWRKAARAVKVRDRGERRQAEVIEHVKTGVRVNNRPRYRLRWRDTEGGEGQSMWVKGADLETYPIGAELTVFADPRGKWPAVWEGDVGPAARNGAVRR